MIEIPLVEMDGHAARFLLSFPSDKTSSMDICRSCGNWNPKGAPFCLRCGMHPFEAKLIRRKLGRDLFIAIGVLLLILALAYQQGLL
jgi:ribosomal protein L40E